MLLAACTIQTLPHTMAALLSPCKLSWLVEVPTATQTTTYPNDNTNGYRNENAVCHLNEDSGAGCRSISRPSSGAAGTTSSSGNSCDDVFVQSDFFEFPVDLLK